MLRYRCAAIPVSFTGAEKAKGFTPFKFNGMSLLLLPAGEGWFALSEIDLTGVHFINANVMLARFAYRQH